MPSKVGVDWAELAERETELFREDMTALRVAAADALRRRGRVDPARVGLIERLHDAGAVYQVEGDLYFSVTSDPAFGEESRMSREEMRGCSPSAAAIPTARARRTRSTACCGVASGPASRAGTARSAVAVPAGTSSAPRSPWTCSGTTFDVQGGGSDLVFPHHEMCANEAQVATGRRFAQAYVHAGMVGLDGEKMSKSKGNLVFVATCAAAMSTRWRSGWRCSRHHYRSDWEWDDAELWAAVDTLAEWRRAFSLHAGAPSAPVVAEVLAAMAGDLDAPRACAAVDAWVYATLGGNGMADSSDPGAADAVRTLVTLRSASFEPRVGADRPRIHCRVGAGRPWVWLPSRR